MLTLTQIEALLAEGLRVSRGSGRDYRTVWKDDDGDLMHAHPSDEAGEDWKRVAAATGFEDVYRLQFSGSPHKCYILQEVGNRTLTKVVKFADPTPPQEGMKDVYVYVVMLRSTPISDEDACELAIDHLVKQGFDEATTHPLLVI
ncbi:hypothetical protein HOV23_gp061 [Pseudomonas phage Lana]|uniref:Uncharacterized protein n=1 Tax=Pseudomonas phage Lana TaxID=2530172 RepID=A0A481W7X6_9CAUD|nr:hypothetical protein HOV23_gp061 [Pseudomonas phage Lana]QBJ04512.1 hypothetical protein [Pseudomonas phage Lana]